MDTSEETRTESAWHPWTIILAGGNGRRLSDFLRRIHSDDRPKQFATLIGTRSMLQHTFDRAVRHCPAERILVAITEGQQRWAFPQLPAVPTRNFLVQPRNLDTGPAIALALAHVLDRDPLGTALILPSDHFIHPEEELARCLDGILRAAAGENGVSAILLGARPSGACEGMGWILPGERAGGFFNVKQFAEKPRPTSARKLFEGGALWNTFILAGKARSLWYLLWKQVPENAARIMRYYRMLSENEWRERVEKTYAQIALFSFSSQVLAREPEELRVMPLEGIRWNDWGTPEGVVMSLDAMGWRDRLRKPDPWREGHRPGPAGRNLLLDARV